MQQVFGLNAWTHCFGCNGRVEQSFHSRQQAFVEVDGQSAVGRVA
jgi:hypothetical protein